jgi:hypothetical protein
MYGMAIFLGGFLLSAASQGERDSKPYRPSQTSTSQVVSDAVTGEEYEVYSSLFAMPRIVNGKRAQQLVMGTDTAKPTINEVRDAANCHEDVRPGEPRIRRGPSLFADDVRPLVDDLLIKSRQIYSWNRRFSLRRSYTLLSASKFRAFFRERYNGGWDVFYRKFPDAEGFKTLSRVGFNRDKTKALVYVVSAYTTIDTFTTFVLLQKTRGEWRRVQDYTCNMGRAGIRPQVP